MAILKIYEDTRGHGRCRSCDAPIEWAEIVESGRRMPFDPPIVAVSTETPIGGGRMIEFVDTAVTKSHFATCPDGPTWKKKRR